MPPHTFWELARTHLQQPEYLHVILNPLPVYGVGFGVMALVVALFLRQRSAHVVALAIILASALSAWPTIHYGEQGYDRIESMSDHGGYEWLDAHAQRGKRAEPVFYILAGIAAAALIVPWKFPKSGTVLSFLALAASIAALGAGVWVALAGGQVRHKEFRYGSPPEPPGGYEKMRD